MNPSDIFSALFGGGNNAPQAAMNNYNQIPGIYKQYMDPYVNAGQHELGGYQNELNKMMSDPQGYIQNIMNGYHPSAQYQNQVHQATTAANNAASAGGTLGTGVEQNQLAGEVNNFANQDQQQYLNNVLGVHGQGMQGVGGIVQNGQSMASMLAQLLAKNQQDEGSLNYQNKEDIDKGIDGIGSALAGIL